MVVYFSELEVEELVVDLPADDLLIHVLVLETSPVAEILLAAVADIDPAVDIDFVVRMLLVDEMVLYAVGNADCY